MTNDEWQQNMDTKGESKFAPLHFNGASIEFTVLPLIKHMSPTTIAIIYHQQRRRHKNKVGLETNLLVPSFVFLSQDYTYGVTNMKMTSPTWKIYRSIVILYRDQGAKGPHRT